MEEIKWSKNIRKMSHREFKGYTLKLSKEIKEYCDTQNVRVDYIVPILRSGAVPAVYVAHQLNIIKFAPIQVKDIRRDGVRSTEVLLDSLNLLDKNKDLILLVVEGTFSSGKTVRCAIDEIKRTLPKAKILFACITARNPETLPNDVQKNFYAYGLSGKKVGDLFVYPWETKEMKENHPDRKPENIFY